MGPRRFRPFGINSSSNAQQRRSRNKSLQRQYSVPEGQAPPPPSQTAAESFSTAKAINKENAQAQGTSSTKLQNLSRAKRRTRTGAEVVMDLFLCGANKPRKTYNTVRDLDETYFPAPRTQKLSEISNYNEREVVDPKPEAISAVTDGDSSLNKPIVDNSNPNSEIEIQNPSTNKRIVDEYNQDSGVEDRNSSLKKQIIDKPKRKSDVEDQSKSSTNIFKPTESVTDAHDPFLSEEPEKPPNIENDDDVFTMGQNIQSREDVRTSKPEKRGIHRRSHLPKLDNLHAIRPHSQSSPIEEFETIVLPVEIGDSVADVPITQKALTKRASRIMLDETSGEFAKEFQVFDLKVVETKREKGISAPRSPENESQLNESEANPSKFPDVPIYSNIQHIIRHATTNQSTSAPKYSSVPLTTSGSKSVAIESFPRDSKLGPNEITKVVKPASETPSKHTVSVPSKKVKVPDLEALIQSMRQEVIEGSKSPIGSRAGSTDQLASAKSTSSLCTEPQQPLPPKKLDERTKPHLGINKGIQWERNSCYMDTTLFCMFYQSHAFDSILIRRKGETETTAKIRKALTDAIVEPLRKRNYCEAERIYEFHNLLGQLNPKLLNSFADPEEFLYTLLEDGLQVKPFINFTAGIQDLMHMVTLDTNNDCRESWSSTQLLLEMSMRENSLEFAYLPFPALLLQLPRCDGVLQRYEFVIPNLELDLSVMLPNNGLDTDEYLMSLSGVICYRHGHYTCFHKCPGGWVYFDSMIGNGNSMVEEASCIEDWLKTFQSTMNAPTTLRQRRKLPAMINRLISDAHICIYVPNLSHTPV